MEDQAVIRMSLAATLSAGGFAVIQAGSAETALDRLQTEPLPDVVLMDVDLGHGRMNGIAAAEEIDRRWGVPVVFCSSCVRPPVGLVSGFGYVDKSRLLDRTLAETLKTAIRLHANRPVTRPERTA